VICGPTAGGKSDLAVDLALTLRDTRSVECEIVTADAFQVYKGLDIGTAKPTLEERRGVVHRLVDVVEPGADRAFTVDDWLSMAQASIEDCRSRGVLPIVVGGTHLYIKALIDGLFDGPEPDHALRERLMAMEPGARRAELERVDPLAARRIHPNDARRTVRALEVFHLTGVPISSHQKQWDRGGAHVSGPPEGAPRGSKGSGGAATSDTQPPPPGGGSFILITINWETEALNRRINARVKQMFERGLLEEVRGLVEADTFTPQSAEALGYKQLIPLVREAIKASRWPPAPGRVDEAMEQIKIQTRRFAKNQRTWLRRLGTTPGAVRLEASEDARGGWVNQIIRHLDGLPEGIDGRPPSA
jgi:tRNA dimethylallyltransferase